MPETNKQPDQNQVQHNDGQTPAPQQSEDQKQQQVDTTDDSSHQRRQQPDDQQTRPAEPQPHDEAELAPHKELATEPDHTDQTPVHESQKQTTAHDDAARLQMMMDIPLQVSVELGRTTMQLQQAVSMDSGTVIELDRLPGEPLDMYVNDRLVARGEVVVINDVLALRITEIVHSQRGAIR